SVLHPDLVHSNNILVAFSPDAKLVLAVRPGRRVEGSLELYETTERLLGRTTSGSDDERIKILTAAFSPDGRLGLTAIHGMPRLEGARLWSATGGKLTARWKGAGAAVAFSTDGKQFLEGGATRFAEEKVDPKGARLWDAETLKQLAPPLGHPAPVQAVAFSP